MGFVQVNKKKEKGRETTQFPCVRVYIAPAYVRNVSSVFSFSLAIVLSCGTVVVTDCGDR